MPGCVARIRYSAALVDWLAGGRGPVLLAQQVASDREQPGQRRLRDLPQPPPRDEERLAHDVLRRVRLKMLQRVSPDPPVTRVVQPDAPFMCIVHPPSFQFIVRDGQIPMSAVTG